uniref:Uncharacterized protein n=1 Tax=Glossina pallidipes TaxID=7398 RepID=A0A1A9ZQ73_GLOPL
MIARISKFRLWDERICLEDDVLASALTKEEFVKLADSFQVCGLWFYSEILFFSMVVCSIKVNLWEIIITSKHTLSTHHIKPIIDIVLSPKPIVSGAYKFCSECIWSSSISVLLIATP